MVKRLYIRNLVHYRKHYGVTLPDEGLAIRESLRYLDRPGFVPGGDIQVANVAPFDGPITAQVNNGQIVVGHKAVANVKSKSSRRLDDG